MATLVSPGVSISVIDETMTVGAGPGTVPLIVIATASNKTDASGLVIAQGTLPQYAGKLWDITSQRDLVQTFGEPNFYSVSGTPLNGYPLNEYGLLAAYSYLGIANLARVIRADIDLGQLGPSVVEPTSPATLGSYWFNQTPPPNGSQYGLFVKALSNAADPLSALTWKPVTFKYFFNGTISEPGVPDDTFGVEGDYALTFDSTSGSIQYWIKNATVWVVVAATDADIIFSSVWPDLDSGIIPATYWVKTNSAANGANIVLETMDATVNGFVQVECPLLATDADANLYYDFASNPTNILGRFYLAPVPFGAPTYLQFRTGVVTDPATNPIQYGWAPASVIVGSETVPTNGPLNGQLWYNSLIGLNDDGTSTVDILINDGIGNWININLPGFTGTPGYTVTPGQPTLYLQSQNPVNNIPVPTFGKGDLWLVTDLVESYPVIYKNTATSGATPIWSLVDNTDQTSPNGILFTDARPNPIFGGDTGENQQGAVGTPDLDPGSPTAAEYPKGFLLWNTRYSTNVIKEWVAPFFAEGEEAAPYNGSTGRWVNKSGNSSNGAPYMGSAAQEIAIVHALNEVIASNEDIRAEDTFYNLIATPGYVGTIQAMVSLNEDRKETAFVVGDSPMHLNPTGTSLQNWATNHANAVNNSLEGLVTKSRFLGVWYPSGLTVNPTDGTDVVVPPSHMALHTIAYNDQVAYPWFAPAGLQRGVVTNAASVGYVTEEGEFQLVRLNEGQRDILYNNGINPIRVMPTGGIVIYGQKDRQAFASALDRINVVRLENYLRYQFNELAQPWLFEPNDATTRNAVQNAFTNFLSELITLRALYDFLVVCDLSNNTPSRIDRNELWIDVAIQPVKAIEFIYIPLRIKNTGASLT